MSIRRFFLSVSFLVGSSVVGTLQSPLEAQVVDVRGYASVDFGGERCLNGRGQRRRECREPTPADVQAAAFAAAINGIDSFAAESGSAEAALWSQLKQDLGTEVAGFIVDIQILTESVAEEGGVLSLTARATVDWNGLIALAANRSGSGDYIGIVLLVRSESAVTSFLAESRNYSATTVDSFAEGAASSASETSASDSALRTQAVDSIGRVSESTGISADVITLQDSIQRASTSLSTTNATAAAAANVRSSAAARTEERVEVSSGGSVVRRRDEVVWDVGTSEAVNAVVSGTLADARFEPVEAVFFEDAEDPPLTRTIAAEFASGEELSGPTLRRLVAAAQAVDLPFILLGTVDLGLGEPDPISGNTRAMAVVTARVYDVRGRLPRTLLAVGPETHAGLGPNQSVALNNAIEQAAQAVAVATVVRLLDNAP